MDHDDTQLTDPVADIAAHRIAVALLADAVRQVERTGRVDVRHVEP